MVGPNVAIMTGDPRFNFNTSVRLISMPLDYAYIAYYLYAPQMPGSYAPQMPGLP